MGDRLYRADDECHSMAKRFIVKYRKESMVSVKQERYHCLTTTAALLNSDIPFGKHRFQVGVEISLKTFLSY